MSLMLLMVKLMQHFTWLKCSANILDDFPKYAGRALSYRKGLPRSATQILKASMLDAVCPLGGDLLGMFVISYHVIV